MNDIYSDLLPRHIGRQKITLCQHLNDNGTRCFNYATMEAIEHEVKGFTNKLEGWHIVFFCEEHAKVRNIREEIENYN